LNVDSIFTELIIIFVLILANGFFAGAEIAIIAAGRGRLQQQAAAGNRGAKLALGLAADPNRFLPTVQVGISLIGTFAAAFGGARIASSLAEWLGTTSWPWVSGRSHEIALFIVVVCMTYFSTVLGELAPKRMALLHANELAGFVALPMHLLAKFARPAVVVMAKSTDAVLWLLGSHKAPKQLVSIDDIQHLIETGTAEGVVAPVEQRLAVEALRLGEQSVKNIMRPRVEMDAIDVNTPPQEVLGALAMAGFSRLPVYEENLDQIIGYVHLKDIVRQQYMGWPIDLRKLLHPALFVPETMPIDRLLLRFQEQHNQLAIVLDEFGGTSGMVTLEDVVSELVGEIRSESRSDDQQRMVQREDKSWLIDGQVTVDDLKDKLHLRHPDLLAPRNFSTIAGLILTRLDRIPKVSESVTWLGLKFEVVDMDGPRIDRVLVSPEVSESKS
jgi:putative hemolysin